MGLVDSLIGCLTPRGAAEGASFARLALRFVQENGGITGILEKLQRAGLSEQASSWVGTGTNLPVSAEELRRALDGGALRDLAARLGLTQGDALAELTSLLPKLVDRMTPDGRVPEDGDDLLSQVLSRLPDKIEPR